MSSHLNEDGKFQSDKYPACPPGKVPLSVDDATAQDLLWRYAQRRRSVDVQFSDDLESALRSAGYVESTVNSVGRSRVKCELTNEQLRFDSHESLMACAGTMAEELLTLRSFVASIKDSTQSIVAEVVEQTLPNLDRWSYGSKHPDTVAVADYISKRVADRLP